MSPSHRLDVRGLRIMVWCVFGLRSMRHVKVVDWEFKHHITHGHMHAVVFSYDTHSRVTFSMGLRGRRWSVERTTREREVNFTNKDGSFLVCVTYMHGRSMYMSKRGNMNTLSLYMCVCHTSLHVGTFCFPRQVPHQSLYIIFVFKHHGISCRRWLPYRNSLACGASIRGHARLSSITLTQRERG